MANLLYLVHRLPYPPNKGDKVRSFHSMKHLAKRHRPYLVHTSVVDAQLCIELVTQNKVPDAMAMARPVVASTACAGPIAATLGEELLAAENPDDYVQAIAKLLADPAHADNIGLAARRRVLGHYSWDAHLALIDCFLEEKTV